MTLTAVFEGNSPADLYAAESFASNAIGGVSIFTGQASWQDYTGSVGWEEGLWSGFAGTKLWSIPLFANGANLHDAAQGAYDGYYADVAKTLAAGQASGTIYVRTGWEFNGAWEAWYAKGKEADFVGAFRQFVDTFRSVSNRFVFTWSPSIGDQGMDPAKAYPGDKYVDIIGEDFYWNTTWMPSEPGAAWSSMVNQTYGLQWLETFAAAHGKPTAYPEWGVMTSNAAPYVADVAKWFSSHNVVYQSYWDSNADFAGKITDGGKPDVAAAYLAAFITPVLNAHAAAGAATATSTAVGASHTATTTTGAAGAGAGVATAVSTTPSAAVDASHTATTGTTATAGVSTATSTATSTAVDASHTATTGTTATAVAGVTPTTASAAGTSATAGTPTSSASTPSTSPTASVPIPSVATPVTTSTSTPVTSPVASVPVTSVNVPVTSPTPTPMTLVPAPDILADVSASARWVEVVDVAKLGLILA